MRGRRMRKAYQDTLLPWATDGSSMPGRSAEEPRNKQLLIRLTTRQVDVLESVAHLERTTSNTYAHQVLVDHLAAVLRNPRVQADLQNREAYERDLAATEVLRTAHSEEKPPTAANQ